MTLQHLVTKPIHEVYDYLSDAKKFTSVHPVIYDIKEKGNNELLVYERLPLLFIPIRFTYPARIIGNGNKDQVLMTATVMKLVHIRLEFRLQAEAQHTRVVEEIDLRSFLPVHFIMYRIFKKQHRQLFRNISDS